MAHQKNRAVVIGQHLLQQIQGIEIEIVGGLVHDQQIAGLGEQAGEQEARPLAAREPRDGHQGLALVEQEFAQVPHHMLLHAAHHDAVAAIGRQGLPERGIFGERRAALIEICRNQIGAVAQTAAIGGKLAQKHLQEGRLAHAIGADDADAVAAHDAGGKPAQQNPVAEILGDILGLDHQLAAHRRRLAGEIGPARPQDAARALGPQSLQSAPAAFVAAAPRGHAAQIPIALGGDALVEAGGLALLTLDQLLGPGLEFVETIVELVQPSAVQPEHPGREPLQKGAVVADEHHGAGKAQQHLLQPFDGGQIEMVGGLVEQQQIGIAGERAGECCAPALPAGEFRWLARAVQAEAIQQGCDLMGGRAIGPDEIRQMAKAAEIRLLRQDSDCEPRLDVARAGVQIHRSGKRLQDGRFAAAVGTHQRHPLAARDAEADIGEQRPAAEREPRATQHGNGRRCRHAQEIFRSLQIRS